MIAKGKRTKRYVVEEQEHNEPSGNYDKDIMKITNLNSEPSELLNRILRGKSRLPVSPVIMLAARESNYSGRGRFSASENCHISRRFLPIYGPKRIDSLSSCAYVSQFSADGSLLVGGFQFHVRDSVGRFQKGKIRIYNVDGGWSIRNDIQAKGLRWTITDASLSPDNRFLVYSSLTPVVHLVDVTSDANVTEFHEGVDMSTVGKSFEIFSVKFSPDGRELVAGSDDNSILVYDLQEDKLSTQISAHTSDVNTVCFADESGQLIYSGSDDGLCKVWDKRCLGTNGEAAGALTGHLQGITFIDSRGDGRHLISNGKDQAIKLWDIRKMVTKATGINRRRLYNWNYTWENYPRHALDNKHPNDLSLATYKGHSLKRTLIRCYFSPAYSTGQKYIYAGSSDRCVYIYDVVSGAQVAQLKYHDDLVRDCNWHPHLPIIVSSSWDGTIAQWEFLADKSQGPVDVQRIRG